MQPVVSHFVQGHLVPQRVPDGYVNATALCQAAGRRIHDYRRLASTSAYLKELALETGIPVSKLIWTFRGRPSNLQGTWVHRRVATHLGMWISPRFAVRITSIIDDWMQGLPRHHAMERVFLPEPDTWEKRFPNEFYEQIYRLRGWTLPSGTTKRHQECGTITNEIIYARLAPEIVEELSHRNPKSMTGERGSKHHQFMRTKAARRLEAHIATVCAFLRAATSWAEFMTLLDRAFPIAAGQLMLFSRP